MRRAVEAITSRAAVSFTLAANFGLVAYLVVTAMTARPEDDQLILGFAWADARPLYLVTAAAGLVFLANFRSQHALMVWVVLLTLTSFGRALDLFFRGNDIYERRAEIRGAMSWALHWGLGVVSALLLTAYALLNDRGDTSGH